MAFTGRFGDGDAVFSNIVFGSDTEAGGSDVDINVENTISLTDFADPHIFEGLIADPMTITDTVLMYGDRQIAASNAIVLTDTIRIAGLPLHVSTALGLSDSVTQQLRIEHVSSALSLTQDVAVAGDRQEAASNSLGLSDTVEIDFGVSNQFVSDTLAGDGITTALLHDTVNLTYELSLQDTLSLSDTAFRIQVIRDTLSLTQTVSLAKSIDVRDVLSLEDTIHVNAVYRRTIDEDIGIEDSVTFYIDREGSECTYTPFIGDGPNIPPPPSSTPPTLGQATLTLTYPYVSPTSTLVLRNPDFGNTESLAFDRVARESRGGTLEVFRDPIWGKTTTLKLAVGDLSQQQREDFLQFLVDSLGKEIGLLDWENRQWRGLIITPDADVTDSGYCKNSISFDFEGDLV